MDNATFDESPVLLVSHRKRPTISAGRLNSSAAQQTAPIATVRNGAFLSISMLPGKLNRNFARTLNYRKISAFSIASTHFGSHARHTHPAKRSYTAMLFGCGMHSDN